MTPKDLKESLLKAMAARLPVLIKGAPGIGKSDIVEQVAKELKMDLIISHPVVSDPTDAKGLPAIVDGKAEFLPYGELRKMMEAKKPTIVFLDDLGQAPAVVQAAFMQLILARRVNGHKVSKHVVFIAATNRRQDRAGVTGILEPVKSRFASIIELTADASEWIDWALENDVPMEVIGWIHYQPSMLTVGEATADIVNHPCPRTIAYAGKLINAGMDSLEELSGALGQSGAASLKGFIDVYRNLPDLEDLLEHPDTVEVPEEPSALYATAMALVERGSKENAKAIFTYVGRFPKQAVDVGVFLIRDLIKKTPAIQNTTSFITWATNHSDILLS